MEALVEKRRCIRCGERPRVCYGGAFGIMDFLYRCGCWGEVDGEMQRPEPKLSTPKTDTQEALGATLGGIVASQHETGMATRGGDIAMAAPPPMTVEEFKNRTALIKAVVGEMQDNVHYGLIPKTKGGRSLWEPGAEYLRAAFRIAWDYVWLEEHEDYDKPLFRYRCRAFAFNPDGSIYSAWEATASSAEPKFNGFPTADLPNIVRDRTLKRAFVNLIRNVTGTSGEFKGALDTDGEASAKTEDMPFDPSDMTLEDWMGRCPIHGVEWRENRNGFAHTYGDRNKTWCNRDRLIAAEVLKRMEALADSVSQSKQQVNAWIKSTYGGRTRSALTEIEQIEMVDAYGAVVTSMSDNADEEKDATAAPAPESAPENETPTGPTAPATKRTPEEREREAEMSREMGEQLGEGGNDGGQ